MIALLVPLAAHAGSLGGYRTVHPSETDHAGTRVAFSPDLDGTTATQVTAFGHWLTENHVAYRASVSGVHAVHADWQEVGLGRVRGSALKVQDNGRGAFGLEVAAGIGSGVALDVFADAPRDALSGFELLAVMDLGTANERHPTVFHLDLGLGGSPFSVLPVMGSFRLSQAVRFDESVALVIEGEISSSFRPADARALVRLGNDTLVVDAGGSWSALFYDLEGSSGQPMALAQVRWFY